MKAEDLMCRVIGVVHPDATAAEVASLLKTPDSGAIPVCDRDQLIGVVTHHDLARVASRRETRVRDLLTSRPLHCRTGTDAAEAATLMRENRVRWLPVLDPERRMVGVLALADIPVVPETPGGGAQARGSSRSSSRRSPQARERSNSIGGRTASWTESDREA